MNNSNWFCKGKRKVSICGRQCVYWILWRNNNKLILRKWLGSRISYIIYISFSYHNGEMFWCLNRSKVIWQSGKILYFWKFLYFFFPGSRIKYVWFVFEYFLEVFKEHFKTYLTRFPILFLYLCTTIGLWAKINARVCRAIILLHLLSYLREYVLIDSTLPNLTPRLLKD